MLRSWFGSQGALNKTYNALNFTEVYGENYQPPSPRNELDEQGKLFLPMSVLHELTDKNYDFPFIFEVSNVLTHATTHVGVLEFSAQEGACIMPYWLMDNLGLRSMDLVKLRYVSLRKATFAKLQAQDTSFLDITDHRAVLEYHLVKFSCLTKNEIIRIHYNNKSYDLRILELKAGVDDINAGCIIDTDLSVDFAAPVGYVEPTPEPVITPAASGASSGTATHTISFGKKPAAKIGNGNGNGSSSSKIRGVHLINGGTAQRKDDEDAWFSGKARTINGGVVGGRSAAPKTEEARRPEKPKEEDVWVGKPRHI
ncbi:Ubiquitin fusion degradation protein UFD1 [Carpediemonas membranifera]|uniref:Ubiquitin fusion degradation protein UFD1 n=1 Tax=Carpediemonas membranifera TaxID=201153 RepID=A0A8J6E205_9EUKA|nr:Ubiquitin fusion degradation protein UFD1 [Carpediemonas membranifera]|eukprot:KAG9397014.1 Ubiquitin fusion degradation protein UFD1 [Carpediemonas membranifera]